MTADVKLLPEPNFGDWLRGIYASERNPQRDGMYVRTIRRSGRMNPGKYYEVTDGNGKFWQYPAQSTERIDRANVAHATAAKDAEVEALRSEVERLTSLTAVTMGVGRGDGSLFVHGDYESIKAAQALVFRAERLAEELRIAIRQNSHDMLMTGDELRQCEAALHPTAAQGDEAASA